MGEIRYNQPTPDYPENQKPPLITPKSTGMRIIYGLVSVVLPLVSFSLTLPGNLFTPAWQNGNYFQLMVGGPASYYFYPLLIYSMLCMTILLNSPSKAVSFYFRWGVYTGVILSLQYLFLIFYLEFDKRIIFYASGMWLIVIPLLSLIIKKLYLSKTINEILKFSVFGLLGISCAAIVLIFPILMRDILTLLLALFFVAPVICLFVYLQVSIRLIRYYEIPFTITLGQGLTVASWLGTFLVAWRFSTLKAIELYSHLPTNPPDCYIATAAAKGHPTVVRSRSIVLSKGYQVRINTQLQYLKACEIAIKVISPNIHLRCRTWYDHYGRALALLLTTPTRASLAYLGLKPLEWTARALLCLLLPGAQEMISKIYYGDG